MEGKKLLGILILILITTMLSVNYFLPKETPNDQTIEITFEQFKFTPSLINVNYNSVIKLKITSLDVSHRFQLEEFELFNIVTSAGRTVEVTFTADIRGTFFFYCTFICGTGYLDHLGTLVVI